jgi:hypothetical protein
VVKRVAQVDKIAFSGSPLLNANEQLEPGFQAQIR